MSPAFPLPAEPFQKKGISSRRWSARRPGKNVQSAIELICYGLISLASPTAFLPFLSRSDTEERAIHAVRQEWQGKGPEHVSVSSHERAYRRFNHIFEEQMESGFQSLLV